jgi:hypothetical protein
MLINHLILHVLDFVSGICVFSQNEHPLDNPIVNDFIIKHIRRAKSDFKANTGVFRNSSPIMPLIGRSEVTSESFVIISSKIADLVYKGLINSDNPGIIDLIVVDLSLDNESFLAVLMVDSKTAFTHQVVNANGVVNSFIIQHHSILPSVTQKIESYAVINKQTQEIVFSDKRRYIDGKDVFVLRDYVLQCSAAASGKDIIKSVSNIVTKVAEAHGQNSAVALSKAKNFILENAEVTDILMPVDIGKEVFADSEEQQHDYNELAQEAHLPKKIKLEQKNAVRTGKNHKIKTDTGIELTIPTAYFDNHRFVEFINNPDGTISIELKNIGRIINK